jgi:hypothetical protein
MWPSSPSERGTRTHVQRRHAFMLSCTHTQTYASTHARTHIHMHTQTAHTGTHTRTHAQARARTSTHGPSARARTHEYTRTRTHTHAQTCRGVCTAVFACSHRRLRVCAHARVPSWGLAVCRRKLSAAAARTGLATRKRDSRAISGSPVRRTAFLSNDRPLPLPLPLS